MRSFHDACEEWWKINNLVYREIEQSVSLEGSHFDRDHDKLQTFKENNTRDATSLHKWINSFFDDTTEEVQQQLLADVDRKLQGLDYDSLSNFVTTKWNVWCRIRGNSRHSPAPFFRKLVHCLPNEPANSPVVNTRAHLADKVSTNVPPYNADGETTIESQKLPIW